MSRKASANLGVRLVALQQAVGAMFDHPPRRQAGQFVIIGRPEQLILDGLLFADVGRARQQQIAVGDANRPMGGEKDLFDLAAGHAFFRNGSAAGAEQFKAGFAALVQFLRWRSAAGSAAAIRTAPRRRRSPAGNGPARPGPSRRPGSILKTSLRILSSVSAAIGSPSFRRGGLQVVVGAALHDRRLWRSLL